ncbi:MAG TPA: hypothetical protein VGU70_09210 [Methylobacterium sp.]|nr:hypothetical protein [Methylobacterium sp.]
MPNVIKFRPRQPSAPVSSTAVLEGSALRAEIEAAAQAALDTADRLIAILDGMEGGSAPVPAGEATDPEIMWLHGRSRSPKADAPEIVS